MDKKSVLLACIAGVILLVVLFTGNSQIASLQAKEQSNAATITRLKGKIEEARQKAAYEPPRELDDEEKDTATYSAKTLGDAVAGYQNAYKDLSAATNREAFDANVKALTACFGESDTSACVPWYSGEKEGVWAFVTDGEFTSTQLGVLWLCRTPDTQELVAYAKGTYDTESGLFFDISYAMTYLGANSVASSGDAPPPVDVGVIDDIAQGISNAEGVPDERELTDEEMGDVWSARQQLKEAMEKEDNNAN